MKTFARVLRGLKRYRFRILLTLLLSAVTVVFTLAVPILAGRGIDLIRGQNDVAFSPLLSVLAVIGVSVLLSSLAQWLCGVLNNKVVFGVVRDIRDRAFAALQHLPLSYLDRVRGGEIVSRLIADTDTLADGLLLGFTNAFTSALTILGTLLIMFGLNPFIASIVVVMTPISLAAAAVIAKSTYKMFGKQARERAEQTAFLNEMVANRDAVEAFGREAETMETFHALNDTLTATSRRATFFSSLTNPVTRFVNSLVYAAVGVAGSFAAVAGKITVGELSSFLSYANQYTKPFNEISGVVTELQNALACAGRVFALIDEPLEPPERPGAHRLETCEGNARFEDVCFSYDKDRPLLRELSFTARQGQRVAIVGPTGCGKTTLINLIMRFYDADSGVISIDGEDIRNLTRESLRRNIGMVLQDTWLKTATVRENIALGRPGATEEEIIAAAKAARAHSFITRLPRGYDTVLEEGSGGLSQGQRQLLCIARLMLALPPMLILDEATSSIDTRTEVKIQSAFAKMMEGRTSFIVAHRLSTIREADWILCMRQGRIVEQGTHRELMARNGFYARLYTESQKALGV